MRAGSRLRQRATVGLASSPAAAVPKACARLCSARWLHQDHDPRSAASGHIAAPPGGATEWAPPSSRYSSSEGGPSREFRTLRAFNSTAATALCVRAVLELIPIPNERNQLWPIRMSAAISCGCGSRPRGCPVAGEHGAGTARCQSYASFAIVAFNDGSTGRSSCRSIS
jgi:hypothetical protein